MFNTPIIIPIEKDFGLLADLPNCLSNKIGSKKFLACILDQLIFTNFTNIIIISTNSYSNQITKFINSNKKYTETIQIKYYFYESTNNFELLADWYNQNKSSYIDIKNYSILFPNAIIPITLDKLINFHNESNSHLTLLLTSINKQKNKNNSNNSNNSNKEVSFTSDINFVSHLPNSRLVINTPFEELTNTYLTITEKEEFNLQKGLLDTVKSECIFRSDLKEIGVYIIDKWIFNFIVHKRDEFACFQNEAIRYIIHRQFVKKDNSNKFLLDLFANGEQRYLENSINKDFDTDYIRSFAMIIDE